MARQGRYTPEVRERAVRMLHEQEPSHPSGWAAMQSIAQKISCTAMREIRKQPKFDNLPVIAMTANVMVGDRQKALDAGMNDHIPKPIDVEHALRVMAKWIRPSTAPPVPIPAISAPQSEGLSSLPGIDTEAGLKLAQGRVDLYRRLLTRFAESESDFPDRFRAALADEDMETATRHAHTLKGVSASIGANELKDIAASLEQACVNHDATKHIDTFLGEAIEGLDLVLTGIAMDRKESVDSTPQTTIEALPKMLAKLGVLLEDDEAGAVDFTHEIAQHPAVQEHQAAVSELVRQVEEYGFDTALKTLHQLMQQFIADSNG